MDEPLLVRISRKRWGYGHGSLTPAYGLDPTENGGKMCCLGFVRVACGIKNSSGAAMPSDAPSSRWPEALRPVLCSSSSAGYADSTVAMKLAEINDDDALLCGVREASIIGTGAEAGIRFEFYGDYR